MQPLANMELIMNEACIKHNHLEDGSFTVSPSFTRNIIKEKDGRYRVELITEITNTKDAPFPVDIRVNIAGIFTVGELAPEALDHFLKIQAIQILFPYVRTMISNLTANSFITPIVLPVIDVRTLFEE